MQVSIIKIPATDYNGETLPRVERAFSVTAEEIICDGDTLTLITKERIYTKRIDENTFHYYKNGKFVGELLVSDSIREFTPALRFG